ncbi:MAG TPA: response regulator [Lacunisphaera sp.]|nr:response regulator [Lacunisphaera sp.]
MNSLRILVVEDHTDCSQTLCSLLERRGHHVTRALTAREAMEVAKGKRFDLAIMDIGLPDDNGWNLFVKLKRQMPGLPAIALTGYGLENDHKRSAIVGFAAHLTKPIEMRALDAAIERLFPARKKEESSTV